jgi:hypothetical protein
MAAGVGIAGDVGSTLGIAGSGAALIDCQHGRKKLMSGEDDEVPAGAGLRRIG